MRQIKFRGKRLKDGGWVYGLLTKDISGHYRIQYDPNCFSAVVIPETVGQFTGLIDRNDNEIYEGDIVKYQAFSNWNAISGYEDSRNIGAVYYRDDKTAFYISMKKKVYVSGFHYIGKEEPISITCETWGKLSAISTITLNC